VLEERTHVDQVGEVTLLEVDQHAELVQVGEAGHVLGLVELGGVLEITFVLVHLDLLHGLEEQGTPVNPGGKDGGKQHQKQQTYSGVGEPDGPGVAILLGDGASGGLILMKNPNPGVLGPLLGLGLQLGCGNRSALHLL